jgi:hypothetical protein
VPTDLPSRSSHHQKQRSASSLATVKGKSNVAPLEKATQKPIEARIAAVRNPNDMEKDERTNQKTRKTPADASSATPSRPENSEIPRTENPDPASQ